MQFDGLIWLVQDVVARHCVTEDAAKVLIENALGEYESREMIFQRINEMMHDHCRRYLD